MLRAEAQHIEETALAFADAGLSQFDTCEAHIELNKIMQSADSRELFVGALQRRLAEAATNAERDLADVAEGELA